MVFDFSKPSGKENYFIGMKQLFAKTATVQILFLSAAICIILIISGFLSHSSPENPTASAVTVPEQDFDELKKDQAFREQIQREYDVYNVSRKNNVDPEELTDAIIEGIYSDRFSPFSGVADISVADSGENSIEEIG